MDIIGIRFGKLIVISNSKRNGYVICKCDCGNIKEIRKTSLTKLKSPTRSCGCIQKQVAKQIGYKTVKNNSKKQVETNKKYNTNFQVIENNKPPKNNKSGIKGVCWDKSRNKWEVYISIHNKKIHLGRYASLEDAIKARKSAEDEYYKPLIQNKNKEN